MKTLRVLAGFVMLVGACLTGRALYLHAKAELAGILIRRAWEQSIGTGTPHAPWPWADTHPIAGNLVLAGHRTSWFRPLQKIASGDTIEIDWFDVQGELHNRNYRVETIRVTKPEDVSLLTPTPEDSLTLITCFPFGRSPKSPLRFVVRASPSEAERTVHTM